MAICIDNVGIEEKFDKGVKYNVKVHGESDMLWVCGKDGIWGEYLIERFRPLEKPL